MKRHGIALALILLALGLVTSCAGTNPPTSPDTSAWLPAFSQGDYENHNLMGVWQVVMYEDRAIVNNITPRSGALTHFNVKNFLKNQCDDCITFSNFSHDSDNKILAADVTLKNPTAIEGADVRGIVMSNNPDVYLINADDYTKLWDPDDPADINPFRLFGKELTDGIVEGGESVTEHFDIQYDELPAVFMTAADVIYPTDSLREPYEISNQTIEGDLDTAGLISRRLDVDVYDRNDDTGTVTVVNEDLDIEILLVREADTDHFYGSISNSVDSPGEHLLRIEAADSETAWVLYDFLTITVSEVIGGWETTPYILQAPTCPRDLSAGVDTGSGFTEIYTTGGDSCDQIISMNADFSDPSLYFDLNDIDPMVSGFNPFPITRMDSALSGGIGFFADNDDIYSDPYYTGPVSSLLVTLYSSISGFPEYTNNGDGDASRIYPSDPALRGVDVTDDTMGELYGLWADPAGVLPPEIYGIEPVFTRHAVFMGGELPPELVGDGPGKVSANLANLRAFEITEYNFDTGVIAILESDGVNSELEIISFLIDFLYRTTSYSSMATIDLPGINAIDVELYNQNSNYPNNTINDSLAILVQGSSGGYVKMYNATERTFIEDIGSDSEPVIPGNAVCLDVGNQTWDILCANDAGDASATRWTI